MSIRIKALKFYQAKVLDVESRIQKLSLEDNSRSSVMLFYENGTVSSCDRITGSIIRSKQSQMFFRIGVFKNFVIFTGKHLCWSLFLIKLQTFRNSFFPEHFWCSIFQPRACQTFFYKYHYKAGPSRRVNRNRSV